MGLALDPLNPGHMSQYTLSRLASMQIPVDQYLRYPRDLSVADLNSAQHVVAVKESEHRPLISKRFPQWLDRVEFWEVHDIDCASPEDALPHLEKEVFGLLQRLKQAADPKTSP